MSSQRSKRVVVALTIAVLVAVVCTVLTGEANSMLFVGDLPGFYGLGRLVLEGHGDHLYDLNYQREVQNRYWPILNQGVFPTMYPPIVALAMAAVAWIPPIPLRFVLAGLEIGLLVFSLRRCTINQQIERWGLLFFAAPILVSVVGIQNTTFSIALTVILRELLRNGRVFISGVVTGLLFYKPQIGVVVGTFVAISAGSHFFAGLVVSLALQYAAGIFVCKGEWLMPWIERIAVFSPIRSQLDGYQMTGVIGHLPLDGVFGVSLQMWELGVFSICMGLFLVASWVLRKKAERWNQLFTCLLITFPVFVPQTMFYDLGLAVFWLVVTADLSSRRVLWGVIGIVALLNLCFMFRSPELSLVPVAAMLVAVGGLGLRQMAAFQSVATRTPASVKSEF